MNNHRELEKIKKALLQLELTEKEIAAYITLLEKGAGSVQDISRTLGINRVTIYSAIEALKRKGLAAETKRGKRTLFVAESPDILRDFLETKKEDIKRQEKLLSNLIIPTLSLIDANKPDKPEIRFFEGKRGINMVYDTYVLRSRDLIGCGSYESAIKTTSWKDEEWFLNQIKKRKIIYRVILADTPLDREFAQRFKEYYHVKFLPLDWQMTADIHVFGSYVSLMSYETFGTTLIKDRSIAQSMKMYLEFMWERL